MASSTQPIPAPIDTARSRADPSVSAGMGSPSSVTSGYSSELSQVFTESSRIYEEPSEAVSSIVPHFLAGKKIRGKKSSQPRQSSFGSSRRKSSESVDSMGNVRRPTFNEFSRGRHSNAWLFGGVSIRETVRKLL